MNLPDLNKRYRPSVQTAYSLYLLGFYIIKKEFSYRWYILAPQYFHGIYCLHFKIALLTAGITYNSA